MNSADSYPKTCTLLKSILFLVVFNLLISFESVENFFTAPDANVVSYSHKIICFSKSQILNCKKQELVSSFLGTTVLVTSDQKNGAKINDSTEAPYKTLGTPYLQIKKYQLVSHKLFVNSSLAPPQEIVA